MRARRALALLAALALALAPAALAAVLEVGSRGGDVTAVQKKLIQWGYMSGTADGRYGEKTARAVAAFQRKNGLAADGRVGPATARAMGVSLSGGTPSVASASIISADHRLLARLVYAEARGETYKGQVAVAAVVLNRVRSASFPNTISGVVFQSGAFSCVGNGAINNTPDATAVRAALDALNGWDPTGGCLYYYNPKATNDQWIRTRTVKTVIGNHQFAV